MCVWGGGGGGGGVGTLSFHLSINYRKIIYPMEYPSRVRTWQRGSHVTTIRATVPVTPLLCKPHSGHMMIT